MSSRSHEMNEFIIRRFERKNSLFMDAANVLILNGAEYIVKCNDFIIYFIWLIIWFDDKCANQPNISQPKIKTTQKSTQLHQIKWFIFKHFVLSVKIWIKQIKTHKYKTIDPWISILVADTLMPMQGIKMLKLFAKIFDI